MRLIRSTFAFLLLAFAAACDEGFFTGIGGDDPRNLQYRLVGGDAAGVPLGVLLTWDPPEQREAWTYAVYSRTSTAGEWYLAGITTSPTFHDAGAPQRQYYVAARDEDDYEFGETRPITIDFGAILPAPQGLTSVTLNRGVHLAWANNAYQASPERFEHYRVYSTSYSTAAGCATDRWQLEGTTITPAFVISGLTNGVTRCFAVSALSRTGIESDLSASRTDTPRYDARHVVVDAFEAKPATAGFMFHDVAGARFGAVTDGLRGDIDFRVERAPGGGFLLRTYRAEVRFAPLGTTPVPDLSTVDVAPASGYTDTAVEALPGHAYAIRIARADGIRYGVVRVAYVAASHIVIDWAYQTDPGNPELDIIAN